MSICFGPKSIDKLHDYLRNKQCSGCNNTKIDIYTILVISNKVSYLYSTCIDCELSSKVRVNRWRGELNLYKNNSLITKKPTPKVKSILFEVLVGNIDEVVKSHIERYTDRSNTDLIVSRVSPDVMLLLQSYL
jgi:hypothetical protein